MALEPRVSAIVVVRNVQSVGAQHALDLSLRAALAEPWIDDLVIVDAGNAPGVSSSLRALSMDRRDAKLVVAPPGASAGAAANVGADQARGRWLLFLAPDVVLQRGAAERLAAAGGGARAPWIAGGMLTDAEGRERSVARAGALNTWSAVAVALGWNGAKPSARRGVVGRNDAAPLPAEVGAVSAALMLAPKRDFQALGGFHEDFLTDAADLDLCRRARAAGGSVLFQPVAAGVQFSRPHARGRKQAQGLALFAVRSARTPIEKAFAIIASPALSVIVALRDFVAGRPPSP
ncbi:MAG: glycosyltransferase [Proteobacteria bacterium]|nr:glycosyltransferase [Pseudomonadota bacterium]